MVGTGLALFLIPTYMTQPREVGYGLIEPIVIEIRRYFINFRLMLLDGESLGNKKT
jgi:hypothetical protein